MDGMDGMAASIGLAMLCIVLVAVFIFAGAAFALTMKQRKSVRAVALLVGAILGIWVGVVGVQMTFYEADFYRKRVTFEVPSGFAHEAIVVLEDPAAPTTVDLSGYHAEASLPVARGGVLRVRSIEPFRAAYVETSLSTGQPVMGSAWPRPPAGLGVSQMVIYSFVPWHQGREPNIDELDDAALIAIIRAREAER